jgi:hypothetical protein
MYDLLEKPDGCGDRLTAPAAAKRSRNPDGASTIAKHADANHATLACGIGVRCHPAERVNRKSAAR